MSQDLTQTYTVFLTPHVPQAALPMVVPELVKHKVRLVITNPRKSKYGDYRSNHRGHKHQISVNGNLNKFAFLETLLHELAHLLVAEQYGRTVQAHGTEWQNAYRAVLMPFLDAHVFPSDIEAVIRQHTQKTTIGACDSPEMTKVFRQYNPPKTGKAALLVAIETLAYHSCFANKDNKVFVKCELLRKKYKCIEVATGNVWLFGGIVEVTLIDANQQTDDMQQTVLAIKNPNSNNYLVSVGSIAINQYFKTKGGEHCQVMKRDAGAVIYKNLTNNQLYKQNNDTLVIPIANAPNTAIVADKTASQMEAVEELRRMGILVKPSKTSLPPIDKHKVQLDALPLHSFFKTDDGKTFLKGKLRRIRYQCTELSTNTLWTFGANCMVVLVHRSDLTATMAKNAKIILDKE